MVQDNLNISSGILGKSLNNISCTDFQYAFFATITLLLISSTDGFLLDDDCPVTTPCDCFNGVGVHCEYTSLTRIPTFRNVSYKMSQPWIIELQGNSISYIPDNAFSSLQEYGNGNNVSVKLGGNDLGNGNISDSAFSGIESLVVFIGLDQNHLQFIPSFVSKLPNLKGLNLLYNPITYIDSSIFISINKTLTTLKISVGDLPAWQQSLKVLTKLEILEIETNHHNITASAFTGLNNTLRRLTIENTAFVETTALCSLSLLETLYIGYSYSTAVTEKNIVNCTSPMNSTTSIQFSQSTFQQYPDILKTFPYLDFLGFLDSDIRFINDSLIPAGSRVKQFQCENCKLKSVPGAINLFLLLEKCYLYGNDITTVERNSFDNLRNLSYIVLENNPIIYISRFAFRNLVSLDYLSLSSTKLTTIPQAVTTLPSLQTFSMAYNIRCACGPIWMKQWANSLLKKMPNVLVLGGCKASNETLSHFILHTLPNCP